MRYVIAGSSGFLGTALRDTLARHGHEVVRLVRGDTPSARDFRWDPYAGQVDLDVIASADVVVNLAGASQVKMLIPPYRKQVTDSRVQTTRTLAEAIAAVDEKPVFLAQSTTGIYGPDCGDVGIGETSPIGQEGYVRRLLQDWEAATSPADEAGARVCRMRTGAVLDRRGGLLQVMVPVFRLGLGLQLGDGQQYFPIISLSDWADAVMFLAENADASGVYNVVSPNPPTNAEFTAALARALHRPALLRMPAVVLRKTLRDLSGEALGSLRVLPTALRDAGFTFHHQTVDEIVQAALRR